MSPCYQHFFCACRNPNYRDEFFVSRCFRQEYNNIYVSLYSNIIEESASGNETLKSTMVYKSLV